MGPETLHLKLAWRALAPDFETLRGAPDDVDETVLARIEQRLRERLKEFPTFAGRPFELPVQLKSFYLLAQNQLRASPRSSKQAGNFHFYAPTWLLTDGFQLADEAEGDSAPWLEIGAFDERTWVFICCDPEDPMFGAVLPCTDSTPWSRTVYERETFNDLREFLDYLVGS